MRLLVFAASVALGVAAVAALDWWVDPYAERYDGGAVTAALAHRPPCFVSHTVVGERTWPEFKLDLVRRRRAETVVVGTSRVWKLAARREERFANLSLPGMGVDAVPPLFRRLDELGVPRLVVELGVESLWFGGAEEETFFDETIVDDARLLLSGETLRATMGILARAPGALRDPRSLRPWHRVTLPRGCVVDRGSSVTGGAANAWGDDGTWHWQWDLTGQPVPDAKPFVVTHRSSFLGARMAREKVATLERALAFARKRGWRVIGFAPPFTSDSLETLASDPATAGLLRDFRRRMPAVFARHGFRFLDLSDVRDVPCDERQFTWNDGAHVDDACARRLRERLEAGG